VKKFLFLLISVAVLGHLQAQRLSDSLPKNLKGKDLQLQYLNKSRSQKGAAFVLLASGLTLGVLGSLNTITLMGGETNNSNAYTMMAIGAVSFVASIPLFISAAKNKEKSKLVVRDQQMIISKSICLRQTGVGLAIPLR
jgi:hypothetical protein